MSQVDEILNNLEVSEHEHDVDTTKVSFTIDPFTRNIAANSGEKVILIQGDHNSKRFSFKMPRYIEGHDMALCNVIYIPYLNIETEGRDPKYKTGVYPVEDLEISSDEENVTFTWLVSGNATKYEGIVSFSALFSCITGKRVDYRWGTNFYEEVYVTKSLEGHINFTNEYVDVIEAWKEAVKEEFAKFIDLKVQEYVAIAKDELNVSLTDYLNGHIATFNNQLTSEFENMHKTLDAFDEVLETELNRMSSELATQKARMDNFTSLKEGSTTGDAELADIRVGANGKTYENAGAAVRGQIGDISDIMYTSSNTVVLKDFVKSKNLARIIDVTRTNTDGTVRTIKANSVDRSKGVIDGVFTSVASYMPLTDYIPLEAGKTYSVYVYDESQSVNYNMFLYTSAGSTYTENGKNKGVASSIYKPFGIIKPEVSDSYCFGIYLDFEATFHNNTVHVYVVEGEYEFDDFVYLNTKDHIDMMFDNISELNAVPDVILDNNLVVISDNSVITDHILTRSSKKYDDVLTAFNGFFKLGTVTPISKLLTLKADTIYTAYAISKLEHKARIVFLSSNGSEVLNNNGVNVTLSAVGLTQFKTNTGGEVQAALYSAVDQTLENESLALYIVEGAYSTVDFHKYVTTVDFEDYMANANDANLFKQEILDNNIITMVGSYLYNGLGYAVPSVIDKSVTKLNGVINTLRISNNFELEAGKTYTVCAIDNVKDINYHIFFGDVKTGIAIQMNGVNKGFGVANGTHFGLFTPDTSNTAVAYIYASADTTVADRYLRLIVLEGEYEYEELINLVEKPQFDYDAYNIPVVKLTGDTEGISKDDKVTLNYEYGKRTGICTLKWQGSSSIGYPKKNYTITFDNAFEAKEGWGEQKKYCMKANWIDFSHARNVVSAKLWGQVVKSRTTKNESLYDLPNGGAIDGFPVIVVINDEYQGLYTFNIPKDAWMFNMGNSDTEYVVVADAHTNATRFKTETTVEEIQNESTFAIEYLPDNADIQTMVNSLNNLISTCINSTGASFRDTVEQVMDMESAIDYYIFTCLLCGADATDKNYILGSFDGDKWFFSAYDLDTTFGNVWDGKSYYEVASAPTFRSYKNTHRLMHLIYTYDTTALKTRYAELRATVLSEANILNMFSNFLVDIPKALFDEEVRLWPGIPGTQTNNLSQIINYYMLRCKVMDAEIEAL